ncbi:hypothetical protein BXQ17_01885 [Polaribacter sp. BM10]|uniref:hypothetical protein n=1 Tax=Polaribacter sp. BM10 TaxID=1529069 RepID=UPI00098AB137|nr:hypothetical protein [Polaribacter sp. BM10]AQS92892.1 hypothetical protein BXQ17_01885 [Polaribacter sp. BM10]
MKNYYTKIKALTFCATLGALVACEQENSFLLLEENVSSTKKTMGYFYDVEKYFISKVLMN